MTPGSSSAATPGALDLTYDYGRDELLEFVPERARRVLDVGCGVGLFPEALGRSRLGLEVWGVEPDPLRAEAAGPRCARVLQGLFPSPGVLQALAGETFDVLTFNDVLEHMAEPAAALRVAAGLLNDSGVVVASIPNVRHRNVLWPLVAHGAWDYEDRGCLDRTHLRFFTRRTATELFTDLGWDVQQVVGINRRWNWNDPVEGRKVRYVRAVAGDRLDDFLYVQYVVTARPPAP